MKCIDAGKLKEELYKVRQDWLDDSTVLEVELDAVKCVLDSVDDIIDSLQQEQPEVDLEKEIKIKKATLLYDAFGPMNGEQSLAIRNFARHFYELKFDARKEE